MANPADMTDEELNKVVETGVEPDEASPPEEPAEAESSKEEPAEVPETPENEPEPEAEAEEPAEEKPPSRREQLRIQDLLKKYGPPQERRTLKRDDALDYQTALDADPEVIKQLEEDRKREGDVRYNAGLEQAKTIQFHTRLEVDAPRVEGKYAFLNPSDKEKFDPVRANAMNQLYLNATGYYPGDPANGIPESVQNPNIRYREFVEAQMEFAEALMADRQSQTVKNITQQAAATGLRPDGSSAKRLNLNRNPQDMTMEELYASIGQTPPKQ